MIGFGVPAGASARFLAAARWGRRDGEDELNDEQKDVFGDEDGGGKDDNDDGNDDDYGDAIHLPLLEIFAALFASDGLSIQGKRPI